MVPAYHTTIQNNCDNSIFVPKKWADVMWAWAKCDHVEKNCLVRPTSFSFSTSTERHGISASKTKSKIVDVGGIWTHANEDHGLNVAPSVETKVGGVGQPLPTGDVIEHQGSFGVLTDRSATTSIKVRIKEIGSSIWATIALLPRREGNDVVEDRNANVVCNKIAFIHKNEKEPLLRYS